MKKSILSISLFSLCALIPAAAANTQSQPLRVNQFTTMDVPNPNPKDPHVPLAFDVPNPNPKDPHVPLPASGGRPFPD